jgi:deaminated glutathione amidase
MTSRTLRVGLTQWHPTLDVAANTELAVAAIRRCAADRAQLVVLPENGLCLGTNVQMRERAVALESDAIRSIQDATRQAGGTVVLGGVKRLTDDGSVRNSALVIDPGGRIAGIYDKIHLFNALVQGRRFDASSVETAGDRPLVVDVAGVRVGVMICFDVRFPELSRTLARAGAEILLVPSAFTEATGAAHWETLLRARAIENAAFVVASATISGPEDPMATYGHALVVDPWGEVLADLRRAERSDRVLALNLERRAEVLARLPVLSAARPDTSALFPTIVTTTVEPTGAHYG